jgi:hypothetical protein
VRAVAGPALQGCPIGQVGGEQVAQVEGGAGELGEGIEGVAVEAQGGASRGGDAADEREGGGLGVVEAEEGVGLGEHGEVGADDGAQLGGAELVERQPLAEQGAGAQ